MSTCEAAIDDPTATPPRGSSLSSSGSRDARARRSAVALRQALLDLLQSSTFDHISIREICARAQVHYATFFRHYVSKEALLDDIATQEIADLNRITLESRGVDNYRAGIEALCRYVDDRRALWTTLLNGGAGAAMREEWMRQSRKVAASEMPASWLPMDLGIICASTLIAETLSWWLGPNGRAHSAADVADILFRLLTTPIIQLP
ncbi:MAG: TetR family transcriptional regulator [Sphingomonadales bacterium]|nr:TetR family transcriptional regulator [Sphingomonadales bacterium]